MSPPARAGRSTLFRDLSARLEAPLPDRTGFLRELAFDLEQLTSRFVEAGHPLSEARDRAVAALVPDGETLAELERVHASWYRRITRGLDARRLKSLERRALVLAGVTLVAVEGSLLIGTDLVRYASSFLAPVLLCGTATLVAVLAKWFELWVKRDHARPGRGMGVLLGLSVTTLGVAVGGTLIDLVRLATTLEATPERTGELALHWLIGGSALLSVAILFAMTGALGWLVASHWIAAAEQAHDHAVMLDSPQLDGDDIP